MFLLPAQPASGGDPPTSDPVPSGSTLKARQTPLTISSDSRYSGTPHRRVCTHMLGNLMFSCHFDVTSVTSKYLIKPVVLMVSGFECTLNMTRTLTPPRAGAPVTRRSMLQRWRTHAAQEAPQWFPLCESNTLPWIRQINRWFPVPKYCEWVDMGVVLFA